MKEIKKGTVLELGTVNITITEIKIRAFLGRWDTDVYYEHDGDDSGKEYHISLRNFLGQLEELGITPDR